MDVTSIDPTFGSTCVHVDMEQFEGFPRHKILSQGSPKHLGRSDYAAVTTTRRRREGNGVPLEPEDRCRGPVTRDRRDQLRHVPLPALGLHRQARRHQGYYCEMV